MTHKLLKAKNALHCRSFFLQGNSRRNKHFGPLSSALSSVWNKRIKGNLATSASKAEKWHRLVHSCEKHFWVMPPLLVIVTLLVLPGMIAIFDLPLVSSHPPCSSLSGLHRRLRTEGINSSSVKIAENWKSKVDLRTQLPRPSFTCSSWDCFLGSIHLPDASFNALVPGMYWIID